MEVKIGETKGSSTLEQNIKVVEAFISDMGCSISEAAVNRFFFDRNLKLLNVEKLSEEGKMSLLYEEELGLLDAYLQLKKLRYELRCSRPSF